MASRTKGFTLIELTVVIVILAIISAVAVPKFINLSGDAKKAKIASVAAELRFAIDLIYYKSLILGVESTCYEEDSDQTSMVEGFYTCGGYPVGYISSIKRLLNLDNNDEFIFNNYKVGADGEIIKASETEASFNRLLILSLNERYTNDATETDDYCQLIYQPYKDNKVVVLNSGC